MQINMTLRHKLIVLKMAAFHSEVLRFSSLNQHIRIHDINTISHLLSIQNVLNLISKIDKNSFRLIVINFRKLV